MKRFFAFWTALLMLAVLGFSSFGVWVRTDRTISQKETETLENMAQSLRENYDIEAFFLMNYDYEGGDEFKTYARSFLTENAETENALVFAVSSSTFYMNTRGNAGKLLKDEDLNLLYEAIQDADEAGDQYQAAVQFYRALDKLLAERTEKPAALSAETTKAQTEPDKKEIVSGAVEIPDEISPVRGDRLVDQADLLEEADETALRQKLDSISEALQFDVVIVTTEHIGSRSPMEFADDYFDYNGFGYGDTFDGCVLMISMAERDWWISTCGFGETALSDDYFMEYIRYSKVISKLGNGYYSASFNAFADIVNDFVTEAKTNEPYSRQNRYHEWKFKVAGVCVSLAVGLLAGFLVMKSKRDSYVSVIRKKGEAAAYLVGPVQFGPSKDTFLRSNVTKTRHVESTGSSSTSSRSSYSSPGSHVSSSGRSHGGGGGKF